MLTPLGKFLRKLRIDHGEILKDMADRLGVTASFLSAVENGKKRMPSAWNRIICSMYRLNDRQIKDFTEAIAETEDRIEMDLRNASDEGKKLAVSFARKFTDFDESQIQSFIELLKGDDHQA